MADFDQRPYEVYGFSWLRWQVPRRFNGQPTLLSDSLPGSQRYQENAMSALERFGSRLRGNEMRLQDLDWAMIVETVLARVLVPPGTGGLPARPRSAPVEAELDFSRHRIVRAPPTISDAREYMLATTGLRVPEDHHQAFGAWVMDCLFTEATVRAGARPSIQYVAVLNSLYRRVAMAAAGAATAGAAPYWHGDLDVGEASDHRIGNVYESIAGVWFIEQRYDKIMDLLCFIIDIQAPVLDDPAMTEFLRGSESIVWGGPLPATLLAFPEYVRTAGRAAALTLVQDNRERERHLIDRYRVDDLRLRPGLGVEIDYAERGRHGGARRVPSNGTYVTAGLAQGTPMIPILQTLLPELRAGPPEPDNRDAQEPEPRYFPMCAACQDEAVQGQEWAWFGARGGCGHGMHTPCWDRYVTHHAANSRRNLLAGRGSELVQQSHVPCPTCRSSITGEIWIEHGAVDGVPTAREQFERIVVPNGEPGGFPTFVPRVPRIAFPEHVDREDGRLRAPARETGPDADERGHVSDATSASSSTPATSARAAPPPRARNGRGSPDTAMARRFASGDARAGPGGNDGSATRGAATPSGRGTHSAGAQRAGGSRDSAVTGGTGSAGPPEAPGHGTRPLRDDVEAMGEIFARMASMANNPELLHRLLDELEGAGGGNGRGPRGPPRAATGPPSGAVQSLRQAHGGEPRFAVMEREVGYHRQRELSSGHLEPPDVDSRRPHRRPPHGGDGGLSGPLGSRRDSAAAQASGASGGEFSTSSARRSRTRGRRNAAGHSTPGSTPRARESSRERPYSSERDARHSRGSLPAGGARGGPRDERGGARDGPGGGGGRRPPLRVAAHDSGRTDRRREDARSRGDRGGDGSAPAAPRRRPISTHVSQEEREEARFAGIARVPEEEPTAEQDWRARQTADGWYGTPADWDGQLYCGHRAGAPAGLDRCAACFMWREHRTTRLPCGHQPDDTKPLSCDVCRFYIEDHDERRGRPRRLPCGQPLAAPIRDGSCIHCRRADCTHGPADLLFCGHSPGAWVRHCPSCRARRLLLEEEGRSHVDPRRIPDVATVERDWSPPNRYCVMIGEFGTQGSSRGARQRVEHRDDWLFALGRTTGYDPRELRQFDEDGFRRHSRSVETRNAGAGVTNGDRARAARAREDERQSAEWVRDTHPRHEGRGEHGESSGAPRNPRADTGYYRHRGGARERGEPPAPDRRTDADERAEPAPSGAAEAGATPHGRPPYVAPPGGDGSHGHTGSALDGGRGRAATLRPGPDALDGLAEDGGDDHDDDGGDGGGPARDGGGVALVPGPGDDGADPSGGPRTHSWEERQAEPPADAAPGDEEGDGGWQEWSDEWSDAENDDDEPWPAGDAPGQHGSRQGGGSWRWSWWEPTSGHGGSSRDEWWHRSDGGYGEGDPWSTYRRGRTAWGSARAGYDGKERSRPKPADRAAELGRQLTREEWIEEFIADPPHPSCPEFRSPGSWERWVRGAFRNHGLLKDAKSQVKMKRANVNSKYRGVDTRRNGAAASMDPSTAALPRAGPAEGRGKRRRGQSSGGGGDSTGARGSTECSPASAAASAPMAPSAGGATGARHGGAAHAGTRPTGQGGRAAGSASTGGDPAAGCAELPPPGLGSSGFDSNGSDDSAPAGGDGGRAAGAGRNDAAAQDENYARQEGGDRGPPSCRGPPGPVAPGPRDGVATEVATEIGDARPEGSPSEGYGCGGPGSGEGDVADPLDTRADPAGTEGALNESGATPPQQGHGGSFAACAAAPAGSATTDGGITTSMALSDGTPEGTPEGGAATAGVEVKQEVVPAPSPPGAAGTVDQAAALPVHSGGDGSGGPATGDGSDRGAEMSDAGDELPSFELDDESALAGEWAVTAPRESSHGPCEEASSPGAPGPAPSDQGHSVVGVPSIAGPPHGAASPPAITVFGGGIGGVAPGGDDRHGNSGACHRVALSDSDSDLVSASPPVLGAGDAGDAGGADATQAEASSHPGDDSGVALQ